MNAPALAAQQAESASAAAPTAAAPASPRFDHIRALFVQTPASLVGYLIGWSLMLAMYGPLAPRGGDHAVPSGDELARHRRAKP